MEAYNVRSLLCNPAGAIPVQETLEIPYLAQSGEEIPLLEPITVSGEITAIGGGVLRFDGTADTKALMNCARCNEPVEVPFRVEISQRFAKDPESSPSASSEELTLEEVDAEPIENERVDLEDVILYEIKLSIPMKVLCKEDCKGLCPVCGQNLNKGSCSCVTKDTDPRWDALKGLSFE